LDKYLPPDYSTVVYTAAHNDGSLLAEYHLTEDEEKKVRKAFVKRETLPKILLVTEKLLTGFDAPILYCMYLDKPMRDHTLLQAIARVNRPYEEEGEIKKPAGFVVDFVGIFDNLEKALAFDSDVVASVIKNIDALKDRFSTLMKDQAPVYLALCQGPIDDKAVERAIDTFAEKEKRERFYKFFKELETLYEIISPDPFLREHLDNYGNLSNLYRIVRNAFAKGVALYKDLAKKTEGLIRERATAFGFKDSLPLVKIDEKTLETLRKSDSSDPAKVINLGRSLAHIVYQEEEKQPYLLPIGERSEAVLEWYDDRQVSTQEALKHLERLLSEYLEAKRERERSGFDLATFTIYWVLKQDGALDPIKLAPLLNAAISRFPNYIDNPLELRQLKAELYKLLLPAVGKDRMVEVAERILKLQRK
jgi:type I restriction enzyme R subunit